MKAIAKTETHEEFLARGGKITKCPTKEATKKYSRPRQQKIEMKLEEVDMTHLPVALKIAYGIK